MIENKREKVFFIIYNVIIAIIFISAIEFSLGFLLRNPKYIPQSVLRFYKDYYNEYDRVTIQMDTSCACYDNKLFYTLKPGECDFKNREFDTKYYINSSGLRDHERNLFAPETIFLGDSFCMGWGVDQDFTYVRQYADYSGVKTLNCGISSYGTAREITLLKSLDLSNLKTIVIQYHPNDSSENKRFIENDFVLKVSDKNKFVDAQHLVSDRLQYFPGKLIMHLLSKIIKGSFTDSKMPVRNYINESTYFYSVLCSANIELSGIKVFVFELNNDNQNNDSFITELNKIANSADSAKQGIDLRTIRLSEILVDEDYFILDNHMKVSGHKKIANHLLKIIN